MEATSHGAPSAARVENSDLLVRRRRSFKDKTDQGTNLHPADLYSWREKRQTGYGRKLCFRLNIGTNDLVTFYDGDDLSAKVLGQYGGSKARFKLYTSTADVTVQFQSDPATNVYGYGNGFVLRFFGKPPIPGR